MCIYFVDLPLVRDAGVDSVSTHGAVLGVAGLPDTNGVRAYKVVLVNSNGLEAGTCEVVPEGGTCPIDGLEPNTEYLVTAYACGEHECGDAASFESFHTKPEGTYYP